MTGFLNLAPELRNRIYELALTHNRFAGRLANVVLLRTCKQVHNEAQKMLPALSTACIKLVTGDLDVPTIAHGDIDLLFRSSTTFPSTAILHKISQINVHLDICMTEVWLISTHSKFVICHSDIFDQLAATTGPRQKIRIALIGDDRPPPYGTGYIHGALFSLLDVKKAKWRGKEIELVGFKESLVRRYARLLAAASVTGSSGKEEE